MPQLNFSRSITGPKRRFGYVRLAGATGTLAVLGSVLTSGTAHAQILARPSARLSIGGIVSPDADVRHRVGSPFPLGMAEISIPQLFGQDTFVGLGYGERRRDGNSFRVIPLTLTRLYIPPVATGKITGYPYGGAGLAAYFLRGKTHDEGQSDSSEEKTAYGFTTILGYQLPNAYFLEARYNAVTGSTRSMSPGGIWIMLGVRL